ncbi:AGAP011225-PA-like protein [Anopheles sinensis]|uniref:AGAP011225-PA-like protein n=1 Tax=Anopheles sinensis TaxID=74873 RepID=A0A084VKL9_ANOSI|nr:AGAP011225-PA-like protein [Anopheles sinensis]
MENIQQKQNTLEKTHQESSNSELQKIEGNTKTLDILTDTIRNMSALSEKSDKILEALFIYPDRSCRHVGKLSGRHMIHLDENSNPFEVFCEQSMFGGGWTVIQHRFDGSIDFYRNWTEYRNGFGKLNGEFWLGLEYVHQITRNRPHELLVEMKDFHGNYRYARYSQFEVGSESELYELTKLAPGSGTAGDAMGYNKNEKFSTYDRDNDTDSGNCAKILHGAWWYWRCSVSNLNGRYKNSTNDDSAMVFFNRKLDWRSMSYTRMMIRDIIN